MLTQFAKLSLLSLVVVLAACDKGDDEVAYIKHRPPKASSTQATATSETLIVKIGHAAPLTGPQAHLGKDNENGVRLAIDELNNEKITIGGKTVTFELDSQDDMADPRTATTVAQKFVDEKVNAVIGHLNSGTSIPASKIYNDAGIVQISPSATAVTYTSQGYKGAFRVMANDSQQGKDLGIYATKNLSAKNIAIIDDRTAYGQGLADEFEKAVKESGATVVKREFTTDKSTDFNAILTSIKGANPDLIFYGGMDAQAAPMIKQLRQLGITATFMAGDGAHTAEFLKLAANDANGVIASLPGVPTEQMPAGSEFMRKFEAKYGQIQLYAPYCYDAMRIIAAAMQKANSVEPAVYLPMVKDIKYNGVTTTIAFDEKGDLKDGAVSIYKAENGAWALLETVGGAK
jgi:branched-chain amino acid transport system substrate-binding protein